MKTITTDVLIIGAGAAGIRAALAASERGVDVKPLLQQSAKLACLAGSLKFHIVRSLRLKYDNKST